MEQVPISDDSFATVARQIAEKHKSLINGLTKLYDVLIAMRYISSSDVLRPPHSSQTVSVDMLQGLGLESEVINLVKLLPFTRPEVTWGYQEEGIELMPRSKAVAYSVGDTDPDFLADLRWGDFSKRDEGTKLLHPWMLKLTYGGDYGIHMIYNTRDQSIIEWQQVGLKYWDEFPSRSTQAVFSEILDNLQSLKWIPYYDPTDYRDPPVRKILENPTVFQNLWPMGIRIPDDPAEAVEHAFATDGPTAGYPLRASVNRWKAWKKLYHDCGWNTEIFDGEAFERQRLELIMAAKDVEKERYEVGPAGREQFEKKWSDFWVDRASEFAV